MLVNASSMKITILENDLAFNSKITSWEHQRVYMGGLYFHEIIHLLMKLIEKLSMSVTAFLSRGRGASDVDEIPARVSGLK